MLTKMVLTLFACIGVTAGAILAAPSQDRPGVATQARVWVENRGQNEAVPVSVIGGVQVTGTPNVAISGTTTVALVPSTTVQTRAARQTWEYRTLRVATGGDMAALLSASGLEGWEATGLQISEQTAVVVVMKRPRQ